MKIVISLFFISVFLFSCKKESNICNDINTELKSTYPIEHLKIDIDRNNSIDIEIYYSSYYSSAYGGNAGFKIKPTNGFEIAFTSSTIRAWMHNSSFNPDSSFHTFNYGSAKKYSSHNTIFNDTSFTANEISISNVYSTGTYFIHEGTTYGNKNDNPWNDDMNGFIAFRNQSLGIMGWIQLSSPHTVVRTYYQQNDTSLIINENVCQ